ncbi:hypothetical protein, partial [Streptomyces sp. H27-D2]|uniref:hypothetical protein n=1 Tax=Streptomyces sp. H27-D2 TaxID=3046304 RepID=UPI002DBF5B07
PGAHSVLRCKLYQTHFQSVSGLNFNPAAACGALPFGCSDFIRFVSAELIGFAFLDKNSDALHRN